MSASSTLGQAHHMVVILGWGSLIWDPQDLPHEEPWDPTGPTLPLEFSRVSTNGRLTLVIDSEHGEDCVTYWACSSRRDIDDALEDLRRRERTSDTNIGFVDVPTGEHRCRDTAVVDDIREWAVQRGFEGVIWTDLASNFEEKLGKRFSEDAAFDYLAHLAEDAHEKAMTYIRCAPAEVSTPLRRRLESS